jgi:hypothetical protein
VIAARRYRKNTPYRRCSSPDGIVALTPEERALIEAYGLDTSLSFTHRLI